MKKLLIFLVASALACTLYLDLKDYTSSEKFTRKSKRERVDKKESVTGYAQKPSSDLHRALKTVADASLSPTERIRLSGSVLRTFFESNESMVDLVANDKRTIVGYHTAEDYLLKIATVEDIRSFQILEEKRNSSGKISYLKIIEKR